MISVILIGPENSGNIGAVARTMKNFGFKDLVIINPKVKVDTITSRKRSKHAQEIIKKAKIKDKSYLKRFDCLIATTGKLGTDNNIKRSPITPRQLSSLIKEKNLKSKKIGLVFGRESKGLYNEELDLCDFVVSIPTDKRYFSMNLSHAVSVLLYELSLEDKTYSKITDHFVYASKPEKEQIMKNLEKIFSQVNFKTESKKDTQRLVWKRIISKSFLTKREAFSVIGFLKKLIK